MLLVWGCGSDNGGGGGKGGSGGTQSGGSGGSGGSGSGGSSATGGSKTGGSSETGGSQSGGVTSSGGKASGGAGGKGGDGAGGTKIGGTTGAQGGKTGGGGKNTGGSNNGGATTGPTGTGGGTTPPIDGGGGGGGDGKGDVNLQLDKTRQTITGFGINTALGSGTIPISTMFSTSGADGIGFTMLRVGMNTDGSLTGSGISEAKSAAGSDAKIIGSCWSAPANCKSNGKVTDGGYLKEECYDSWSTTIANFASQQKLYAMSVANESDFASCPGNPVCTDSYETMTYTGKQMAAFVKVAGPKLKAKGVKVIAPEASEWIHVWSNLSGTGSIVSSHPDSSDPHGCGCFSNTITKEAEAKCASKCVNGDGYDYGHWLAKDAAAWAAFDILGLHEYDSQIAFKWPDDVNGGKRDREVWQTEMSGVMHWPEQGPSTDINNGVAVAGWIHSALTVGEASAWLWWWYQALYQDDNEGLAKLKSGGTTAKRYYTMGNYSKFVRPGYLAVEVTGTASSDVLISGYKSADSKTVVIVAINKGSAAASPKIGFGGGTAPTSCTPTVTSAQDNLKDGTAVSVADGVLPASLASKTVTTYVCK